MKPLDPKINPKKAQQAALVALYEKTNELVEVSNQLEIQLAKMKNLVMDLATRTGADE